MEQNQLDSGAPSELNVITLDAWDSMTQDSTAPWSREWDAYFTAQDGLDVLLAPSGLNQ